MKDYKRVRGNGLQVMGLLVIFMSLVMTSCSSSLSPSEYVKWATNQDNGLLKTKSIEEISLKVQYKPIPFIIANEMRTNDIKNTEFKQRAKELEGMQYYNLVLDITDARNILNYKVNDVGGQQARIQYLSFGMQQDIYLEEGGKELPCKLFHFERTYNISKERTFLLAFEQDEQTKFDDKTLVINSSMLGTGPIKVKFLGKNLNQIPTMKVN
jgi:hypothetical protein